MNFSFDSWPWKFALVFALLGAREFVRLLSPKDSKGEAGEGGRWLIETLDSATIAIGLVLFVIQPFILQAFYIPSGSMENTLMGPPVENGPGGDRLLVSKVVYRLRKPQSGDVIVFRAPPEAAPVNPDDDFIKRCVGTPGQTVEAKGRALFVNGKPLKEPYQHWDPGPNATFGYDMKILKETVKEVVRDANGQPLLDANGQERLQNVEKHVVYTREYTVPGVQPRWHVNLNPVPDDEQERITKAKSSPIPAGKYLMLGDHRNNSRDGHYWGLLDGERIVGKAVCVFWPPTRLGLLDRMSERAQPSAAQPPSFGASIATR